MEALLVTQRGHSLGEMLMRLAHHCMKISFAAHRLTGRRSSGESGLSHYSLPLSMILIPVAVVAE